MPLLQLFAFAALALAVLAPTDAEAFGRCRRARAHRCCPAPACPPVECQPTACCDPVAAPEPCDACDASPTPAPTMAEPAPATEGAEIALEVAPPAPMAEPEPPTEEPPAVEAPIAEAPAEEPVVEEPVVEAPAVVEEAEADPPAAELAPAVEPPSVEPAAEEPPAVEPTAGPVAVDEGLAVAALADPDFVFPYSGRPAPQLAVAAADTADETTDDTTEDEDDPNRCHWRGWYKCGDDDVWHDFWGNGNDCGEALSDALDWAEDLCGSTVAYNAFDCNCD